MLKCSTVCARAVSRCPLHRLGPWLALSSCWGHPTKRQAGKRAPLVPAKEWAERVGKGGEHGRGSALSPLGECDRLGLTAHKGAEQLGIK